MRKLCFFLTILPVFVFTQDLPAILEVQMFNQERILIKLDNRQFQSCSKFKLSGIPAGEYQLKVYTPKKYINPKNFSINERLVPIYSGYIYLAKNQKTTCIINKYHQKEIIIKDND